MNSLYDTDKQIQIEHYESIREDVHIHAPYLIIREQLLNIKNNPKWLSKNFQQYIHSPDGWYGSDNAHPGIKSHKKIADDLYEVIKTL